MFSCKRCGYQTDVKINIKGHLTRIKPCETIHCDTDRAILLNEIYQKMETIHAINVIKYSLIKVANIDIKDHVIHLLPKMTGLKMNLRPLKNK